MDTSTLRTVTLSETAQLKAIAHETRAAILRMVENEPASASMLAAALDMTPGKVGHHIGVLERAGLIEVVETRPVRAVVEKLYAPTFDVLRLGAGTSGTDRLHFVLDQVALEASRPQPDHLEQATRLVTMRMSPEAADRFAVAVDALAREFIAHTDDEATETYGLVAAVFATDTPGSA